MSGRAPLENRVELQFQQNEVYDPPEIDFILPSDEADEELDSEGEEEIEAQRGVDGPQLANLPPALRIGAPDVEFRDDENIIEENDQEDDQMQMDALEMLLRKSVEGFLIVFNELGKLTGDGPNPGLMSLLLDQTQQTRVASKFSSFSLSILWCN